MKRQVKTNIRDSLAAVAGYGVAEESTEKKPLLSIVKEGGKKLFGFIKRHKILTIFLVLVLIAALVGVNIYNRQQSKAAVQQGGAAQTVTLEKRDLTNSLSLTGTVASAESQTVTTNLTNVEISEVNATEGDTVKKGDVICTFDSSDIEEQLENVKTSLEVSEAKSSNEIEAAQRSLEDAKVTRDVQAERASKSISDAYTAYTTAQEKASNALSSYQAAEAALPEKQAANEAAQAAAAAAQEKMTAAETALQNAQTEFDAAQAKAEKNPENEKKQSELQVKKQALETAQASSQAASQELEGANSAKQQTEETYQAAVQAQSTASQSYDQALESVTNAASAYDKAVQEQEDGVRNNESTVISQQENLENAQLNSKTSTANDETQMKEYEEQLGKCVVTAPFDGVITSLDVEAGDTYNGEDLFVIQDTANFIVEADVDEYDISDITKDMKAVIKTDATGDEELNGTVTYVAATPEISTTTSSSSSMSTTSSSSSSSSTYSVKISLDDQNDRLRIGMTAKTSVLLESREDVFAVPYDCIQTNTAGDSVIYVAESRSGSAPGSGSSSGKQNTATELSGEAAAVNTEESETENTELPERGELPEGVPTDGSMPAEMPSDMQQMNGSSQNSEEAGTAQKEIVVETGLESDYYVEISGDELSEGMQVVIPDITSTDSSSSDRSSSAMDMLGGGMTSGMKSDGGMGGGPGGAAPGGGF